MMALVLTAISSGCCTIFSGRTQPINMNSEPQGAKVSVNNMNLGTTPCLVYMERNTQYPMLKFEKEGYKAKDVQMQRNLNAWLIGDACLCLIFIIPGVVALAVDFVDGSAFELYPPMVNATLEQQQ